MKVLAIIPARGGSKGIPQKNLISLAGKPLLGWSIETAKKTQLVDYITVSTDDEQIAVCARNFGANVVMRPSDLAGDQIASELALLHALNELDVKDNIRPEITVFLQCTSPLTIPEDIDGTIELIRSGQYDSAFSASPFHGFIWREENHSSVIGINHDHSKREMRQNIGKQFLENGAVYAIKTNALLSSGYRFTGRVGLYETPSERNLEIDEQEDLELAELIMSSRLYNERQSGEKLFPQWSKTKLVVTDFDGVLTNNTVFISETGEELVQCNRGDGWGVKVLEKEKVDVVCISTETNLVVKKRCEKMGIECHFGQSDKLACLKKLLATKKVDSKNCLYIGNDTNDEKCLNFAGIAVVPDDAVPEVKIQADFQTKAGGGKGVIREIASLIVKAKNE
ncbi:MAG TPA: acylneuraminate cytidylyltransferase [Nitrospinota bacterium]|nr:acylneuraminate cytidylyltransferase [Nitrospinota bacterium]